MKKYPLQIHLTICQIFKKYKLKDILSDDPDLKDILKQNDDDTLDEDHYAIKIMMLWNRNKSDFSVKNQISIVKNLISTVKNLISPVKNLISAVKNL